MELKVEVDNSAVVLARTGGDWDDGTRTFGVSVEELARMAYGDSVSLSIRYGDSWSRYTLGDPEKATIRCFAGGYVDLLPGPVKANPDGGPAVAATQSDPGTAAVQRSMR